ncbi:hypothetical protein HYU11_02610 [Candidatus Woesearchaeota archaeon]|nr:hypothetical protein [Candidatus Woesearchaeota archaeon]
MLSLKILNSKQVKDIMRILHDRWGFEGRLDYAFLINNKDRIFLVSRDVGRLDFSKLRVNSMGLYFGEFKDENLRLTIEGSQIIGPGASMNVVEISRKELFAWLRGEDLLRECDSSGFVIIRSGSDFVGCGRYSNGVIKNFVPKTRRVRTG